MIAYVHTGWRRILKITGAESTRFLQSLLTLNVQTLKETASHWGYGLFLTPQGRCGTDVFLIWYKSCWWMDCYAPHVPYILQVFSRYKLRSDVQWQEDFSLDSAFIPQGHSFATQSTIAVQGKHPRGFPAGQRLLLDKTVANSGKCLTQFSQYKKESLEGEVPLTEYTLTSWGKIFPLAFHMTYGISFSKGCYVGQERTALTYYRGVIKSDLRRAIGQGVEEGSLYHNTTKVGHILYGVQGRYLVLIKKDTQAQVLSTLPQGKGRSFTLL